MLKKYLVSSLGSSSRAITISSVYKGGAKRLKSIRFSSYLQMMLTWISIETIINKELKKLHEWLINNRLAVNISKLTLPSFSPPNKPLKM